MKKRQETEYRLFIGELKNFVDTLELCNYVAVGERHALGRSRRPARIDKERDIIAIGYWGLPREAVGIFGCGPICERLEPVFGKRRTTPATGHPSFVRTGAFCFP